MKRVEEIKYSPIWTGELYSEEESLRLYEELSRLPDWSRCKVRMGDRICTENRDTAYFVEPEMIPKITVSNEPSNYYDTASTSHQPIEMPEIIRKVLRDVEDYLKNQSGDSGYSSFLKDAKFNCCFANFYRDGKETIGMHRDKMGPNSVDLVACVSFGATRDFVVKYDPAWYKKNKAPQDDTRVVIPLKTGSILIMGPGTHDYYKHGIPQRMRVKDGRISLTYRIKYLNM